MKNALGLGPNATGLILGAVLVGTYYGSAFLTKRLVMQKKDEPAEKPQFFRDIALSRDRE